MNVLHLSPNLNLKSSTPRTAVAGFDCLETMQMAGEINRFTQLEMSPHSSPFTGDLVLFLHGFPSLRSRQNRELAKIVCQTNSVEVLLPLYRGLGFSKGEFRFSSCLKDVQDWIASTLDPLVKSGWGGRIKMVGHSWGGFLSLALAQMPEIRSRLTHMILLSPLVYFAPPQDVEKAFAHMTAASDLDLSVAEPETLAQDFGSVGKRHDVSKMIQNLPADLKVQYQQATVDQMTPPEAANKMRVNFGCDFDFKLVDQEHSFLNDRVKLGLELAEFLRS